MDQRMVLGILVAKLRAGTISRRQFAAGGLLLRHRRGGRCRVRLGGTDHASTTALGSARPEVAPARSASWSPRRSGPTGIPTSHTAQSQWRIEQPDLRYRWCRSNPPTSRTSALAWPRAGRTSTKPPGSSCCGRASPSTTASPLPAPTSRPPSSWLPAPPPRRRPRAADFVPTTVEVVDDFTVRLVTDVAVRAADERAGDAADPLRRRHPAERRSGHPFGGDRHAADVTEWHRPLPPGR